LAFLEATATWRHLGTFRPSSQVKPWREEANAKNWSAKLAELAAEGVIFRKLLVPAK
jgi:hypothetical protein